MNYVSKSLIKALSDIQSQQEVWWMISKSLFTCLTVVNFVTSFTYFMADRQGFSSLIELQTSRHWSVYPSMHFETVYTSHLYPWVLVMCSSTPGVNQPLVVKAGELRSPALQAQHAVTDRWGWDLGLSDASSLHAKQRNTACRGEVGGRFWRQWNISYCENNLS